MRAQYRAAGLTESELAADPYEQFARWFADASGSGLTNRTPWWSRPRTAEGRPSSRTVLLKGFDERGFVFFTNYTSRKGRELEANPYVSLLFPWHPMARQVIVGGRAVQVSREETVGVLPRPAARLTARRLGERAVGAGGLAGGAGAPLRGAGRPLPEQRHGARAAVLGRLPGPGPQRGVLAGPGEPAARPIASTSGRARAGWWPVCARSERRGVAEGSRAGADSRRPAGCHPEKLRIPAGHIRRARGSGDCVGIGPRRSSRHRQGARRQPAATSRVRCACILRTTSLRVYRQPKNEFAPEQPIFANLMCAASQRG